VEAYCLRLGAASLVDAKSSGFPDGTALFLAGVPVHGSPLGLGGPASSGEGRGRGQASMPHLIYHPVVYWQEWRTFCHFSAFPVGSANSVLSRALLASMAAC
jgi:hypothetical protein